MLSKLMKKPIDISGQRFGKLIALEPHPLRTGRGRSWLFKCDCGNDFVAPVTNVKSNGKGAKSCGCLHNGRKKTRVYRIWSAMRQRCRDPNASAYPRYGGRGISVDPSWDDFETFRKWAYSSGYADNLSIDRVDNDGDYTPDNCRWATDKQQAGNRSNAIDIAWDGRPVKLIDIAAQTGIPYMTLRSRLKTGLSIQAAVEMKKYAKPHLQRMVHRGK